MKDKNIIMMAFQKESVVGRVLVSSAILAHPSYMERLLCVKVVNVRLVKKKKKKALSNILSHRLLELVSKRPDLRTLFKIVIVIFAIDCCHSDVQWFHEYPAKMNLAIWLVCDFQNKQINKISLWILRIKLHLFFSLEILSRDSDFQSLNWSRVLLIKLKFVI